MCKKNSTLGTVENDILIIDNGGIMSADDNLMTPNKQAVSNRRRATYLSCEKLLCANDVSNFLNNLLILLNLQLNLLRDENAVYEEKDHDLETWLEQNEENPYYTIIKELFADIKRIRTEITNLNENFDVKTLRTYQFLQSCKGFEGDKERSGFRLILPSYQALDQDDMTFFEQTCRLSEINPEENIAERLDVLTKKIVPFFQALSDQPLRMKQQPRRDPKLSSPQK